MTRTRIKNKKPQPLQFSQGKNGIRSISLTIETPPKPPLNLPHMNHDNRKALERSREIQAENKKELTNEIA